MNQIKSIELLQQQIAEIRSLRRGFLTNFYLDPFKHMLWIVKGDCYTAKVGETLFVIRKDKEFWNVFYCSTTLVNLYNDISVFMAEHSTITMMFDIVGRDVQCKPVIDLFRDKGCKLATSLVRMTRMTEPIDYTEDPTVRKATEKDINAVSQLLHEYFDARTEQIPYDDELYYYARQGHVLICEEQGCLAGFLIYEINATTLYLRYWFTHPDYREKKVGSRLLRKFFEEGKYTKRQLFWVIQTNENAIMRYKHYGFNEENMFDYVMQYN